MPKNRNRANALSVFWNNHQRFFNALMISQKIPSLLSAMERDLEAGYSPVVQIISTNEALMTRKLAEIPPEQYNDIQLDVSPKESVLNYVQECFPTFLYEKYEDEEGKTQTRQVFDDDGNPVHSQEALALREEMLLDLALLPPMPTALDAIIFHFGHENVAEVTGRQQRFIKNGDKIVLAKRSDKASLVDSQAFMNGEKRILIFSKKGNTGESYHADITCGNTRLRRHYLLEAGWSAADAVQGLGRCHRSSQLQPPVFIPVTVDIPAEKRFTSAIARKMDALGALTKGSRKAGSQNLWSESDNLENTYARQALRDLIYAMRHGRLEGINFQDYQRKTGLDLLNQDGSLKDDLTIQRFLNRNMALEIEDQRLISGEFVRLLDAKIQQALESGTYETGVEVLKAHSFRVLEERELFTHRSGAKTYAVKLEQCDRRNRLTLEEALNTPNGCFYWNSRSNRVAFGQEAFAGWLKSGEPDRRMRLYAPDRTFDSLTYYDLHKSYWQQIEVEVWAERWQNLFEQTEEFRYHVFYLIVGLLTPIYSKLPKENVEIYRLQTECGRTFLGRKVKEGDINAVYRRFGLIECQALTPDELWNACYQRHEVQPLGETGWKLRVSQIAHQTRLEITGIHNRADWQRLTSLGCFTEIISGQLRVFIPAVEDQAKAILSQLLAV